MATAITTRFQGRRRAIVTAVGDGLLESTAAIVIPLATVPFPEKMAVSRVQFSVGTGTVRLYYDRTTPIDVFRTDGGTGGTSGVIEYPMGFKDTGTGGTGNLLLTTVGTTGQFTIVVEASG